MSERVDKDSLPLNQPRRTPSHPTKSHIVKTKVDGKEKILRFGEQGASTAGKPKAGESERMKAKRASFKARHAQNIAKGQSSPAYWANKVKWAEGGSVELQRMADKYLPPEVMERMEVLGRQPSAVERATYDQFGMEPGVGNRPNIIPVREDGEWTMPGWVYDAGKAFVSPGTAMRGQQVSPEDVLNTAMTFTGGSLGASHAAGPAAEAGTQMLGMAVKNKGGNWLDKSVAEEIKPLQAQVRGPEAVRRLRQIEDAYAQNVEAGVPVDDAFMQRVREQTKPDIAINNWLETKLNSYLRNDMGTPEDPVRELAERGTLHFEPQQRGPQVIEELRQIREMEGLPGAGFGQSELARRWETATDTSIAPGQAKRYLNTRNREGELTTERYPWLLKVPPETKVYDFAARNNMGALGFNHLVDELRNATLPGTDLPERLRIDYNKLDRMTVPQIVEKVADISAWRAAQKVEASQRLANNAATTVFKEYPEQGLKWVALRQPEELPEGWRQDKYGSEDFLYNQAGVPHDIGGRDDPRYKSLEDALKYEGDTMGHCVGGYCPEVSSGDTKIFSLRDAKGQPHVTIEAKKPYGKSDYSWLDQSQLVDLQALADDQLDELHASMLQQGLPRSAMDAREAKRRGVLAHPDAPGRWIDPKSLVAPAPAIYQVKGKGNAKPADKYLPFVQDFVKTQGWNVEGDLKNTGLVDYKGATTNLGGLRDLKMPTGYVTPAEASEFLQQQGVAKRDADLHTGNIGEMLKSPGFAAGGYVTRKYAEGGDVAAKPSFLGALKDPQFRQDVTGGFRDAAYRGAVAGTLGAPVDLANMVTNLGRAGYGYLGNKMGLLSAAEMPRLDTEPVGGSEWIGNKMQEYNLIGDNRNPYAEVIAGMGLPLAPVAVQARVPQMVKGLDQLAANYAAKGDLNTAPFMGQRGAVKAQGNLNLTPMARAEALKGSDTQTAESFLNQLRSQPGMTQSGFDDLVKQYQGLEPNTRMTKAEFEQRIPASQYNKVDLRSSDQTANAHLMTEAEDMVRDDNNWSVYDNMLERLGVRNIFDNMEPLREYHQGYSTFNEMPPEVQRGLREAGMGGTEGRYALMDIFNEERDNLVNHTYQTMLDDYGLDMPAGGYGYKDYQRLIANPESHSDRYFELGVTHPEQSGRYKHYSERVSAEDGGGLIGHVRGTFTGEEGAGLVGGEYAKPRSMVIEEIQSDAQKTAGQSGPLRQAHGTMFKAAIQHALENGADTVYYPSASEIAGVRNKPASAYAPIYDQQIVKEGLKPLLKIPGVSSRMLGGYHEIDFTPEAKDFILKGEGQAAPGYAQGGTVRAYDPQQIENIMSSINAPRNYASGGSVLAYDPGRVDAILNQFRGAV